MTFKEIIKMKYPNNKHPKFDRIEKELREFNNTEEAKKQDREEYGE